MAIIKSHSIPANLAPFSMADIEKAARGMLLRARKQADQLLAAAQVEAEQLKKDAAVEGFAEGRSEGLATGMAQGQKSGQQQALNEQTAQLQQTLAALTQAATAFNNGRADLDASARQEVVKLAIALARRVCKRQGLIEPEVLIANIEEAVKLVVQQSDVRITLHPTQRAALEAALPQLGLKWPALKHVELVEDATISPGGCRIATRSGQIDADLDVQLNRIAADLLPTPGEGQS